MRLEIRVAGFGGQGIIRSGLILAMAACIYDKKKRNAVQTQSYGPESRGGACKSEVVISEEEIDFPKIVEPDVLIAMYNLYVASLKTGGTLLLDPDMVPKEKPTPHFHVFRVPATKIAEELGKSIVANVVMLGAFSSLTSLISDEAVRASVLRNIPKGTEKLNLEAFERGYKFGQAVLKTSGTHQF
jgi:2-oxoglutarate ferredoxin oxidoreductase subunit gamma